MVHRCSARCCRDSPSPDALPAVFHCLWGKDRTGVAAALLLSALGVSQADVVDDYMLTEQYRSQQDVKTALARLQAAGVPPEAAAGVASTPGWVIDTVLSEIASSTATSKATCSAQRA